MKYEISEIGKLTLKKQEELAEEYKYKLLTEALALNCMRHYVLTLPEGFKLKDNSIKVADNNEINKINNKPGYEVIKEAKIPIVTRDGTLLACSYERVVIGHYGAFIEMKSKDIYKEQIMCEKGQEYRIHNRKYKDKVKYQWFTVKDKSHCKLYFQKKEVAYADYKEDMWYISPFEVLDKNEIVKMFLEEEQNEQ